MKQFKSLNVGLKALRTYGNINIYTYIYIMLHMHMFNRCFQLFGFPKEGCHWKIRKAKVQCCTEPTPVWNILKHWNHHESSGIVVIHQVASYELALRDRLKLRPEVAVFFPPGRSWLLQVYGIQVWNPMESKMHWKDLKGWFDVQWGIGRLCPSMWQNNTAQGWSNWVMFSRTYCGGGGRAGV